MKSLDKRAHNITRVSPLASPKNINLKNEKKNNSTDKGNHCIVHKDEGKNKLKTNIKEISDKNIINRKMKEKYINKENEIMITSEGNKKKKIINKNCPSTIINMEKDDLNTNKLSPHFMESNRNNLDTNLSKKRANINKIKNSKKNEEYHRAKTDDSRGKTKNDSLIYENNKREKTKKSKSFHTINYRSEQNTFLTSSYSSICNDDVLGPYYETDINIENRCEGINELNKKEIENIKNKILNKYNNLTSEYNNKLQMMIYSNMNKTLNIKLDREGIYTFMKLAYKCSDYKYAIGCAILLLLDRLKNQQIELKEIEKEEIENTINSYNYYNIMSYKYAFRIFYKNYTLLLKGKKFEEKNEFPNNCTNSPTIFVKKNICKNIRFKIKKEFLLNCEVIINIVNCIISTIANEDKNKIFYIHLNANQYKIVSNITDTGVKYKYEQLAKHAYKKAFELASIHLQPIDINFLSVASHYIYFLYSNLECEQKALKICIDVFDKSSNLLDKIEDNKQADKCSRILSKMRYNIKRWSKKLNKNSILFLKI
ncbi:14-3-3 protein, putative [Plasmodium yoelii]|uniref:14-3-3 protein n=2 Tax=Plasmodium yoelii TaxID=5861 RepID=A0AAE9WWS9_PLAYO|nr:14-3-3 protein, putative [Plasmodium yoelii]WBY57992.1 14-3-3 protein [Plasmodium yoelii yoelii]CDU85059.1 14-3-3 protein, putative [Plasmodium yoelii]VTZ78954.1 14-3-3 protein, putative [Plasmodium yoelii]|eukprot:XP_729652.2 14-3-3 protein, putative [Plasmodium yoelii]